MRYLLSCLLFITVLSGLKAQVYKLNIVDERGEALAFATIRNLNTKEVQVADAEGVAYYKLFTAQDSLEISILGYSKKFFVLTKTLSSPQTISLKTEINELGVVQVNSDFVRGFGLSNNTLASSSLLIDKKQLDKLATNDVNQILYSVPGVQIQQEDGFGLRPNIGMRGTGVERSSKITLMEDGVLIAPAPYAASSAYYFPSMDHIESIEIVKSGSQLAYGPQSNGGAINLISTQIPDQFNVRFKASLGSFLTRKVQASVGDSQENFGYLLQGSYFGSNGFKNLPNGDNTGFNKGDLLAKLRFSTKANTKIYQSFNIKYAYTQENTNETYLGLSLDDFNQDPLQRYAASALDNIQSTHTTIQASHLISPAKNLTIGTTVYLNKFTRNWFKLDKLAVNGQNAVSIDDVLNDTESHTDEWLLMKGNVYADNRLTIRNNNRAYTSKGVQTNVNYLLYTKQIEHKLQLGLRLHADEMDRYQWDDKYTMTENGLALSSKGEQGTESNRIESAKAFAGFAQYAIKIKHFSVSAGLRYELMNFMKEDYGKNDPERTAANLLVSENKASVVLPGLSMSYEIKNKVNVFAGIHKGFSPPNNQAETLPEESWNLEAGTKGFAKGFGFEAVFFMNRYKNLLGADLAASGGAGSTDLFNGGRVNVYGLEAMMSYDILRTFSDKFRLPLSVSYTFTDASFQSSFKSDGPWGTVANGDKLPYIAQHQFFMQLGFEQKKFELNLMFKALSAMRTSPSQGAFVEEDTTPFFYQLDLLARYKFNAKIQVFAKANNFTNNIQRVAKHPSGWRPNMPAYFEGGFSLSF